MRAINGLDLERKLDGRWMMEAGSLEAVKIEFEKIKNKFPLKPIVVIANKADLLSGDQKNNIQATIENILFLSAKQKIGIEEQWLQ